LGNPLDFVLTASSVPDITQAHTLLAERACTFVIADKGYDADHLVTHIRTLGAEPVIPSRRNRKQPRAYDRHLYRERHLIECFINKFKHYRRLFTRFDKLDERFMGFLRFVAALIWLR
jgi:transposase